MDKSQFTRFSLIQPNNLQDIEKIWIDFSLISEPSFFQSWPFIKQVILSSQETSFYFLEIRNSHNLIIGLCLFGEQTKYHFLKKTTTYYLHQTGLPKKDQVYIEYNEPLFHPEHKMEALHHFMSFIQSKPLDHFILSGIKSSLYSILTEYLKINTLSEQSSYGVNLNQLRTSGQSYEDSLGKSTKRHLTKAKDHYKTLSLDFAQDENEATTYLLELAYLHNFSWRQRKITGAFENQDFLNFHLSLIKTTFQQKKTHLVRVKGETEILGYFYFFDQNGVISYYQSGISYKADGRIKPGLLAHAILIQYFLENGKSFYDFMAGNLSYKEALGKKHEVLYWIEANVTYIDKIRSIPTKIRNRLQPNPEE
jgi:hypothetical protein